MKERKGLRDGDQNTLGKQIQQLFKEVPNILRIRCSFALLPSLLGVYLPRPGARESTEARRDF